MAKPQEDSLSYLNHQDITLWTTCVSESQTPGSILHQDTFEDLLQTSDHSLPRTDQFKEDHASDLSSMGDSAYMSQRDASFRSARSDVKSDFGFPNTIMTTDDFHSLAIASLGLDHQGHDVPDHVFMPSSSGSHLSSNCPGHSMQASGAVPLHSPADKIGLDSSMVPPSHFSPTDTIYDGVGWEARPSHTIDEFSILNNMDTQATAQSPVAQFHANYLDSYTFPDAACSVSQLNFTPDMGNQIPVLSVGQRSYSNSSAPPVQSLSLKSSSYVPIRPQVRTNSDMARDMPESHLGPCFSQWPSASGSVPLQSGFSNLGQYQKGPISSYSYENSAT